MRLRGSDAARVVCCGVLAHTIYVSAPHSDPPPTSTNPTPPTITATRHDHRPRRPPAGELRRGGWPGAGRDRQPQGRGEGRPRRGGGREPRAGFRHPGGGAGGDRAACDLPAGADHGARGAGGGGGACGGGAAAAGEPAGPGAGGAAGGHGGGGGAADAGVVAQDRGEPVRWWGC